MGAVRRPPDRRRASEDIARLGIAHVPEGEGTFVGFTVEENLRLGAYVRRDRAAVGQDLERVYAHFPVLGERRRQAAGTLSGGEQQMLALARSHAAAASAPPGRAVPRAGLARGAGDLPHRATINERDGEVFLVEQNAALALGLADHAYLLETGRVVPGGPPTSSGGTMPFAERTLGIDTSSSRWSRGSPPAGSTRASPSRW